MCVTLEKNGNLLRKLAFDISNLIKIHRKQDLCEGAEKMMFHNQKNSKSED